MALRQRARGHALRGDGVACAGDLERALTDADRADADYCTPAFVALESALCESVGPPEWDLVSTVVKLTSAGSVTAEEYAGFCSEYGTDVTTWAGYDALAAIRELRMTSYAAQHAVTYQEWRAQHRVDCLRGRSGPRPWRWVGIM